MIFCCAGAGFQQTHERRGLTGWRNWIKPYWTLLPGTGSLFPTITGPAHPLTPGPLVRAFCNNTNVKPYHVTLRKEISEKIICGTKKNTWRASENKLGGSKTGLFYVIEYHNLHMCMFFCFIRCIQNSGIFVKISDLSLLLRDSVRIDLPVPSIFR